MRVVHKQDDMSEVLESFPKKRTPLPKQYSDIYDIHRVENREGKTRASSISSKMEHWLHRSVAASSNSNLKTLEIGAGTLNQLDFENAGIYDIVEPSSFFYENSNNSKKIRNAYKDISEVPDTEEYDRIISVACFEHIENLPEVVKKCHSLLKSDGVLAVSIPNEGRFLWKFAYTLTTGHEFKKRFGLDYEVLMRYEHVNTADEIEAVLCNYFNSVKYRLFGINKTFSFYRYYECRKN